MGQKAGRERFLGSPTPTLVWRETGLSLGARAPSARFAAPGGVPSRAALSSPRRGGRPTLQLGDRLRTEVALDMPPDQRDRILPREDIVAQAAPQPQSVDQDADAEEQLPSL